MIGFGLSIESLGIVPATFIIVFSSALADDEFSPMVALVSAVVLAAMAVLVFIKGLGLPLETFIWFN